MTPPVLDPSGRRVIILEGPYAGQEGVCLGRSFDGSTWMVSPDNSNDILPMIFDQDFGILITHDT